MEQRSKENRVTMLSVHHIVNTISNLQVHEKQIAIGWLGNASFVLKTLSGTVIYLDLYLSDLGERVYGKEFKRLMPPLLSASQVKADLLISTHHHEDHFDTDIVPEIMQSGDILFVGSPTCIELCQKMGIESNRLIELQIGKEYSYKDIRVITVYADHGDLAPDAVGIVLIVDEIRVYIAGDTAYRPKELGPVKELKPDIVIAPINGKFGNLTPEEAAFLARDVGAEIVIPCHYWMFPGHGGDPGAFMKSVDELESKTINTIPTASGARSP
ncbi:MBL fold metallo-hydrolase [Verrucomicrobiota bacterium]